MLNRSFGAVGFAAFALSLPLIAAEPTVTAHKDIPSTLKEAKTLGIPVFVVMKKAKASQPLAAADPRIARKAKTFACGSINLTAALAKQYALDGETYILLMDADGTVIETFAHNATANQVLAALSKHADAARGELLKTAKPDADAKTQRAALAGLMRLGPFAEDLIQLLVDANVKETARKALVVLPPEVAIGPVLDGLKSEDAAIRAAVYPIAVLMTGYKRSTLKVWQSGTPEERTAAWDKWNEAVEAQYPRLNRAVLAFCERNLGVQVNDGECAMLVMDAYAECRGAAEGRSRCDLPVGSANQVR